MNLCVLCHHRIRLSLDFCASCEDELQDTACGDDERWQILPGNHRVLSSFAYRGASRASILACKSQGFRRLGPALLHQVEEDPLLHDLLDLCDVIMPAPSSFWSRWRGSLDLALILAQGLGRSAGLLVRLPPWKLAFRWKKQALREHSQRQGVFRSHQKIYDASYFRAHVSLPLRSARLRVLIVDDVITTGSTLTELAACFSAVDFEFYTLASAFRREKGNRDAEYHR